MVRWLLDATLLGVAACWGIDYIWFISEGFGGAKGSGGAYTVRSFPCNFAIVGCRCTIKSMNSRLVGNRILSKLLNILISFPITWPKQK